jgi:glycosyltransferase involved in cell wall biosynthesis
MLIRILFGSKIIYDVQENYWRNILWTDAFPSFLKPILAIWVRGKEVVLSGFFHLFFLAEKGFEKEMKFFRNKSVVLENKSTLPKGFVRTKSNGKIRLLFSGTISESTGVFEAIHLANVLHQQDLTVRLTIIGYCSLDSTLKAVRLAIQDKPFISLTGGDQLVPHQEIMHQIFNSDFGIIYYPASPHIENRIPTKLYEYMSAQLPILMQNYTPWVTLCEPCQAAIKIDFHAPIDAPSLIQEMKQSDFYTVPPRDVDWSSEEKKLLESVNKVLA